MAGHEGAERKRGGSYDAAASYLALELEHPRGKVLVLGLQQKGIEAATMVNRFERVGRDSQPYRTAERVRQHRDVEQVRQEPPLCLDVRMAHFVAGLRRLAGQLATP
jgi:hypothetical protein